MNAHPITKIGVVGLVAAMAFLTTWQASGPGWGAVSAVALGAGVAVAVFHNNNTHRCPPARTSHDRGSTYQT